MLARASSDAGIRLRRSKSTSTVHRHAPPTIESLDPDTAQQHAIAAATAAFIRSHAQESTERKAPRSVELNRSKSTASRKSLTSQGSHFPPRDLSIRSVTAHTHKQPVSTHRTSTSSAPYPEKVSLSNATPGSDRPISSRRPLSAQPSLTFNEYARPSSQPKSHRPSTASSVTSQQIRKARSMYYASSVQTGSPIARPPAKYMTTPPPADTSSTLSTAPTAYVPSRGVGPSPLGVPQIPVVVAAGETIDDARDKHLQEFQQRSIKHKPSLFLAPFRKRQDRSKDKTKRLSSILTSASTTDCHFTESAAGDITVNDFMPPQDKKDRRSLSGSLKKKIKRVFRRTSHKSSSLPVQQIEASREYFKHPSRLSADEHNDIPSPSEDLLQAARSRTPSFDGACPHPKRSASRSSKSSAHSNRSLHSEANVSQASTSRVTSWGTSASGETLTQRAIKRLTVIHESKDSIGSVTDRSASTSLHRKSLHLPTVTAFRDSMHMESLEEETSSSPVDPKRVFSALMREISAPDLSGSSANPLERTPGQESDVFESSKTKESHLNTHKKQVALSQESNSPTFNDPQPTTYRPESVTARSVQSKKSSIRSFGRAVRSTIRTVTPGESQSPPSRNEPASKLANTNTPSPSGSSSGSQNSPEDRLTLFKNFRLSRKSATVSKHTHVDSITPTAEQIETRVARAKKRWQTPLMESATPQFPRETDRLYTAVDFTQQQSQNHVNGSCQPPTSPQLATMQSSKPLQTPMSPSVYSRNTDGHSILPNESETSFASPNQHELSRQGGSAVILTSQSVRSYVIGTPSPNRPTSARSSRDWKAWLSHEVSGIETASQEDITIDAQYTTPSHPGKRHLKQTSGTSQLECDDTSAVVRGSFDTSTPRAGPVLTSSVNSVPQMDRSASSQTLPIRTAAASKDVQPSPRSSINPRTSQNQVAVKPKCERQSPVATVLTPHVIKSASTSTPDSSKSASQPSVVTPSSARMNDRFPFIGTGRQSSSNNSGHSQKSKSSTSSMRSSLNSARGTPGHQTIYSDISAQGAALTAANIPITVSKSVEMSQKSKENIAPPPLDSRKRSNISPLGLVSRPMSLQPLSSPVLHHDSANIADHAAKLTDNNRMTHASVPAETVVARPSLRITIRPLSPEKLSRRPRSAFDLRHTPSPRPASEIRHPTLQRNPSSDDPSQRALDSDTLASGQISSETRQRDGSVTPGRRMAERFLKERKSATVLERGATRSPGKLVREDTPAFL